MMWVSGKRLSGRRLLKPTSASRLLMVLMALDVWKEASDAPPTSHRVFLSVPVRIHCSEKSTYLRGVES
ncbi:hypothetical protein TNCV_4885461 [Trichonephila clavipes]|nr:hypothetical protein TNCV_4885461 [Trichonephila clavipes]